MMSFSDLHLLPLKYDFKNAYNIFVTKDLN